MMSYLKKILTHPLVIILIFCGIIISGEQAGGFYLFYILLGLPHLVAHAVLGMLGIVCLLFSYYNKTIITSFLCVLGALFMIASLLFFFLQAGGSYNYSTFHEGLPLSVLILFIVLIVLFMLNNISRLINNIHRKTS